MKDKIYIAGPMTGYFEYNFPAFNAAAERLRADGWNVINPVEIVNKYGGATAYMHSHHKQEAVHQEERNAIRTAQAIYLLKGWERSIGSKDELVYAIQTGTDIILEGSEADA